MAITGDHGMDPRQWETLSAWFGAWLAAAGDERLRLRARLAVEHPDLVGEADSLTSTSDDLPGFLETPAAVLAARELVPDDPLIPSGAMLGPYRIAGLLASGGMGDVYRATDVRLRREVALKALSQARTTDPLRVERFMQEARVTASVDHPNVVRVYDVGAVQGRAYLVAELLEGETLRARISRGLLPAHDARRIGVDIARGLGAAHDAGLVHRDLKPENVFLTRSGSTKILDFGVAKLAEDQASRDGFSTATGIVVGTAGYLSPEQIRGEKVDGRADLFALGAVLFEMLTGTRAFAREHLVETLHAILNDNPPNGFAERRDVPRPLSDIVMRLLRKSPDARFQSCAELIVALDSVDVTGRPAARPARTTRAPAKALRRPRPRADSNGSAITLGVVPFRSIPAGAGSELLELGLADVFISRLGQLSTVRVLPLTATERLRGEDPRTAARTLGANRVLLGTLQHEGGLVRATVQLFAMPEDRAVWTTTVDADASTVFTIQDIIVTRVVEELAPHLTPDARRQMARAGTRNNEAFEHHLRGRAHVSRPTPPDLLAAAECFRKALALDPGYADAWAGLGSAYKRLPLVSAAVPSEGFGTAREAAMRALDLDPHHPEAHSVLGTVALWHEWDYERAERLLRRALALQPSSADSQLFLAHVLSTVGRHAEALEEIRRARALDPGWIVPRTLEGQFLFAAKRHVDALAQLDAIVEIDPGIWTAHMFRVYPLLALGRYDDAIRCCDRVIEVRGPVDGPQRPHAHAVALKGHALARTGRTGEAEAALAEIARQRREAYVPPTYDAFVLHGLGRDDEALVQLQAGIDARDVLATFLGIDPTWDDLRHTAGFRGLLAQVNLLRD